MGISITELSSSVPLSSIEAREKKKGKYMHTRDLDLVDVKLTDNQFYFCF